MRSLPFVLLVSLVSLAALATSGSGHVIEENRPIADFHGLSSNGAFVLDVTAGPVASVSLKGDDNLLADIETVVTDGQLIIRSRSHRKGTINIDSDHVVHINVTAPHIDAFSGEGAGKTVFHDLSGDSFALTYNGAGLLTATGDVRSLKVQASGAGSLDLKGLKSKDATVSIDGIGSVNVYARNSLTAALNGIGSLTYYGHPARISRAVNGVGSVSAGD